MANSAENADDGRALQRRNDEETDLIKHRYDRVAPVYDALDWLVEKVSFSRWRPQLWERAEGERILEVGVGTGKNMAYYPSGRDITALDLSPRMLERARRRADRHDIDVDLVEGDAQDLPFDDNTFDAAVHTFVFCSVPDPVRGLKELNRVIKPGGQLLMLEHVLSEKPVFRPLMRWLDFIPYHIWGAHIDRETVENTRKAGFTDVHAENLALDIVKMIEARAR